MADDHVRRKKIPLLIGESTTSRVHTAAMIAPSTRAPVARLDHIGLFAVTAGLGVVKKERQLTTDNDDQIADWARRPATP
jgi:cobalamin-dependent methionine synthase I